MDKEAFYGFLILAVIVGLTFGLSFSNNITASVIAEASDLETSKTSDVAPKCYESDGGINVYTQGTCIDILGRKYEDYCLYPDCASISDCGADMVVEYGCVEGKCYPYKFACPYGCYNGICAKQTTAKTQATTQTATATQTQAQVKTTTTKADVDAEETNGVPLETISIDENHPMWYPGCVAKMPYPYNTVGKFYRKVIDCKTGKVLESQLIITNGGYCNFRCTNRYQEQCILDGSFDKYYHENCPDLPVQVTSQTQTQAATQAQAQATTQTTTRTRTVWDSVAGFFGIETEKEEKEPSAEGPIQGQSEPMGPTAMTYGITYEAVLTMLRDAIIIELTNTSSINCNFACIRYGRTCIHAETQYFENGQWIFHPAICGAYTNTTTRNLHCWCASPPQITTVQTRPPTYAYVDY